MRITPSRPTTQQERNFAGTTALLAGAGIIAIGLGYFPKALQGSHAPLWVIFLCGGVFALAGILLLIQERSPQWVQSFFMNVLLTFFAIIPAWIAWGGSDSGFSSSTTFFGNLTLKSSGHVTAGHIAFTISALIMSAIAVSAWLSWLFKLPLFARVGMLIAAPLCGYLLLVVMPAEPNWPDIHDDHERLARYAMLSEQEGWYKNAGDEPARWYLLPWRNFEQWTKTARNRLAAARTLPPGQTAITIPLSTSVPDIDGEIDDEWEDALRLPLSPEELGNAAFIKSDGKFLYLAGDAPADTTRDGYDQFRFWFHIGLSPALENERIFVGKSGDISTLRTVRFQQKTHQQDYRVDKQIYELARGATSMNGHRRFELALNLEESGIKPGVPFPAWIEIEGDPLVDAKGKFKQRTSMGQAGSKKSPLWFRIAHP
jgi:hypothetical protein